MKRRKIDIAGELREAEEYETEIFFRMARELYGECATQSEELFDVAERSVVAFHKFSLRRIVPCAILFAVLDARRLVPVTSDWHFPETGS